MNQIITSNVNDSINQEQPLLATSLAFLQSGIIEGLGNSVQAQIGSSYSTSTIYVLWGLIRTGAADGASSGTVTITAGAIYYNGEIYTVPAFTGTMATGKAVYSALTITNGSPDPTTFSNGNTFNVHNIRQWIFSIATSGSNAQSTFYYLNTDWQSTALTLSNVTSITGGSATSVTGGNIVWKKTGKTVFIQFGIQVVKTAVSTSQIAIGFPSIGWTINSSFSASAYVAFPCWMLGNSTGNACIVMTPSMVSGVPTFTFTNFTDTGTSITIYGNFTFDVD